MSNKPHNRPQKKARTKSVWIVMDADVGEAHDEAYHKWQAAQAEAHSKDADSMKRLKDARAELDAMAVELKGASTKFTFRAIGRKKFDKLVSAHPPTDEQVAMAKKVGDKDAELNWNPDTFVPALLAQCLVSPELDEEDAEDWFSGDDWNESELTALTQAAMEANLSHKVVQLGNG